MWSFVEFVALTGVLVAQPLFDLMGRNAGLFILWDLSGWQLIVFVLAIVLVPAAALWLVEAVAGLVVRRARWVIHVALVAIVTLDIAIVIIKKLSDLGPNAVVVVAVPITAGFVFLFARFTAVRTWLRFLAILPLVLGVMFAGMSRATDVAFGSSTSLADVQAAQPARVVMVVLDELPLTSMLDGKGEIDAAMLPNFAALARNANWYRNNTTVASFTDAALPAILAGQYPANQHKLPYISDYPKNLFTLLGKSYEMNVHETITRLCPESLCQARRRLVTAAHPGLGGALRDTYDIWRDFSSPERRGFELDNQIAIDPHPLDTTTEFIDSLQPASTPRLDFLHVLIPHFPWHYLPSTQDYAALPAYGNGLDGQNWHNDWVGKLAYQRHLLQLQATDELLGRIVERLRAVNAYDDSLIVVTADHGASFAAGLPFRGVAAATYPNIMWTPLFVKLPNQRAGLVDDRMARSIDIVPTIADVIEVNVPWSLDGRSLLGTPEPDGPRRLLEWDRNDVKPPKGEHYLTFDGPVGFATVMKTQAVAPDPDPALRLYRVGPFGGMIGRDVTDFDIEPSPLPPTAVIDAPLRYQLVDPRADKAPWAQVHGMVNVKTEGFRLAFAVNGKIAAVYETTGKPKGGRTEFWGMLPPTLLKEGNNSLDLYALEGTPEHPILRPAILR
jgi:hypothetical protein